MRRVPEVSVRILQGDALTMLATLPAESVQVCVTSPPYFALRDYQVAGQIGLEQTPGEFIARLVAVFEEVKRVLHPSGLCFVNLGDSYSGSGKGGNVGPSSILGGARQGPDRRQGFSGDHTYTGIPAKNLLLIPERFAIAMQEAGWIVRSRIAWCKKSAMPESVKDRPTSAWEHIFMFSKSPRYFYDQDAVRQPYEAASVKRLQSGTMQDVRSGSTSGLRQSGEFGLRDAPQRDDLQPNPLGASLRNFWLLGPEPNREVAQTVHQVHVAWGDADDDTIRTPSPDCPLHGSQDRQGSIHLGGGWQAESDDQPRSPDNGTCRASGRTSDSAATAQTHAPGSLAGSSDSLLPSGFYAAIPSSTRSHRTAPAPATTALDTPSEGTAGRSGDTSMSPSLFGPDGDTGESSISRDDSGVHPSLDTSDGIVRTSSSRRSFEACTCTYHKEITESISHYAAFPTEIPRRCILAGTSAKGQCPACGAPWVRVVEREATVFNAKEGVAQALRNAGVQGGGTERVTLGATQFVRRETTGWAPSCACDAGDPVPQTVLDPFLGSGTTALVADRLERNAIGVELNPQYAEMARKRIVGDAPMFADVEEAS
jgi:DNA modification methylase